MAKFIRSRFRVLWATVFSFFYGFLPNNLSADKGEPTPSSDPKPAEEVEIPVAKKTR